jgi:hypothetical protein
MVLVRPPHCIIKGRYVMAAVQQGERVIVPGFQP